MISDKELLTPERLVRTGREILYEAVNTRRLVAFVGSGVSLVYGQPTWSQFIDRLREKLGAAIENAKTQKILSDAEAARMLSMAKITCSDASDGLVTLELIRRAYAQIERQAKGKLGEQLYSRDLQSLFTYNSVAEGLLSKRLDLAGISDSAKVVENLPSIGNPAEIDEKKARKRSLDAIYNTALLDAIASAGSGSKLHLLVGRLRSEYSRHHDFGHSSVRDRALPIDRRSSLAVVLAHSGVSGARILKEIEKAASSVAAAATGGNDAKTATAPYRPLLDPLRDMDEWLRIRRYLSTNYDLALEDQHMVPRDDSPLRPDDIKRPDIEISDTDHSIIRQRRDGRVIRSDVNDGTHVAPLFDFALGGVDNTVHIYHLHGRVDRPETLIAADGEYNRLYRSERGTRIAFEHAYDSLIVGNPILFVGSGMTEADLTRVLRANVSNPDVLRAAPAIVLREAVKPQRELVLLQTEWATKLGVRVVYTGHARRGAAYTLRDHLLLIDYVARLYRLDSVMDKAGKPVFRFQTEPTDSSKAHIPLKGPDKAAQVDNLAGLIKKRFRLLWDLDYERWIVPWLIVFAPKPRDKAWDASRSQLVADYLTMLAQKLISAALRHELRQVGHEANEFFRIKSTRIAARSSIASHDTDFITRHVSPVSTLALPPAPQWVSGTESITETGADSLDLEGIPAKTGDIASARQRYVAQIVAERHRSIPPNLSEVDCLSALMPQNAHCSRTIVLGARGIGKGRLLADMVRSGRPDEAGEPRAQRQLYINCCYGQEIDSIATIVDQFLRPSSPDHASTAFSRRERLLSTGLHPSPTPPLIVLGGVDRLFGTDGMPLSVEFEWLLDQLLDPQRQIALLVTGELRCLEFFRKRIDATGSTADERGQRPETGGQGGSTLWVLQPKKAKVDATGSEVPDEDDVGLYAKLRLIAEHAHRPHYNRQDRDSQIRMTHGARKADLLVGDWIETLETGRARFEDCDADDPLALEIVKVCAFVGLPFEADVLVSAPTIKRRLNDIFKGRSSSQAEAKAIRDALARALQLGLVNIVEPFGHSQLEPLFSDRQDSWEGCRNLADKVIGCGCRLVVHRLTAKILKDRFGVPNSANVLSDSYNLSLYAVQPDDASVPEPRVTGELEELIDHLMNSWKETDLTVGKPDGTLVDVRDLFRVARAGLTDPAQKAYDDDLALHYLDALRRMRRRLSYASPLPIMGMRAAGGVIRGYYSAVNLFGLDLGDQSGAVGRVSAISDHKQRIRLLLDLAIEAQSMTGQHLPDLAKLLEEMNVVSAIATRDDDDGEGDGKLQSLERRDDIGVLCLNRNVPEAWHRPPPEPIRAFFESLESVKAEPVCVSGLRTRLLPKEADGRSKEPPPQLSGTAVRPFFDGEIVWLLNERAMLALAQGDLYTASTTFELAFTANSAIERDRYHPNRARLIVNRAYLWIERGRIAEASRELESLRQHLDGGADAIGRHGNEGRLIAALCDGYLGLCNHLSGMLAEAETLYASAIDTFSAMRQQRSVAIFEQHRAALLRHIPGRDTDADAALQRGIAAATGGRHTDILYRLRIAKAHDDFMADKSDPAEVIATLTRAVHYGSALEMHRVAVEALTARAHVHLEFGDVDASSRDVSRAAAKAAQYGMTLRRIWLRVMTGQVYLLRDDTANARIIFERAVSEGAHIGYQRAVEVATRQLIKLKTD